MSTALGPSRGACAGGGSLRRRIFLSCCLAALALLSLAPARSSTKAGSHNVGTSEKSTAAAITLAPVRDATALMTAVPTMHASVRRGYLMFAIGGDSAAVREQRLSATRALTVLRSLAKDGKQYGASLVTSAVLPIDDNDATWDQVVMTNSAAGEPVELLNTSSEEWIFDSTVVVDHSARTICDTFERIFLELEAGWDLLVPEHIIHNAHAQRLPTIGFSRSPGFAAFFAKWLQARSQEALPRSSNAAAVLAFTLSEHARGPFRVGVMNEAAHPVLVRVSSLDVVATLVIHGSIMTYPMASKGEEQRKSLCSWLRANTETPSVIAYNETSRQLLFVNSYTGFCSIVGALACNGPQFVWDSTFSATRGVAAYLRLPTASSTPAPIKDRKYKGMTYGVIMFAYSMDMEAVRRYIDSNALTAHAIRRTHPEIPITLFTNAEYQPKWPFDDAIRIPAHAMLPGRQWWSRTFVLNMTTYDLTLLIDSESGICPGLMDLFDILTEWDMVGASRGSAGRPPLGGFANGVLGYKRGPKFDALHRTWLHEQLQYDKGGDDQLTLARALRRHPEFRAAMLPSRFHLVYVEANRQRLQRSKGMRHSLVMHGNVVVWPGLTNEAERAHVCRYLNDAADRARVFIFDATGDKHTFSVVFSQESCQAATHGMCNHPELNWTTPQNRAISLAEYEDTHS